MINKENKFIKFLKIGLIVVLTMSWIVNSLIQVI